MKPFQALAPIVAMGMLVAVSITVQNIEGLRRAVFVLMLFSVVVGLPEGLILKTAVGRR